ncbi:MAG: undecaprenyl-diphosphate phosphatase [Bacilli bacterium]
MTVTQAMILGALQGLTEFLPISSSGHLVLAQKMMHLTGNSLSFDVFLHFGTLLAVLFAFRSDIAALLARPRTRLLWLLIVSTLPTVAIGLLLERTIELIFRSGATLGIEFVITGLLLLYVEATAAPGRLQAQDISYRRALLIGIAQGAAILPALSRSGLTLCAALGAGVERQEAVRYSFLLSIPVILGATAMELKNVGPLPWAGSLPLVCAMVASALTGYATIRYLLRFIKHRSLRPFGYYAIALGLLVIGDQWFMHRFF